MSRYLLAIFALLCITTSTIESSMAQNPMELSTIMVQKQGRWFFVHRVERRQTIEDIAAAYGTSVQAIMTSNSLSRTRLKVGTRLLIPKTPTKGELAAEMDNQTSIDSTTLIDSTEVIAQMDIFERYAYEPKAIFGRTHPIGDTINIAMILPLDGSGGKDVFVEFYNGALLAISSIQGAVENIAVKIISSNRTEQRAREIVLSGELDGSDMIIGPVFPDEFEIVAQYGAVTRTPIISPLGSTGDGDNAFVVEIAPLGDYKLSKVEDILLQEDQNIVIIDHQTKGNRQELDEILEILPSETIRIPYQDKNTNIDHIERKLDRKRDNIIILPSNDEIAVEEILSRLSSMNVNNRYDIRVIGTSAWARFKMVNLDLFHKLAVSYPTSYYYDRLDKRVGEVFREYVEVYDQLPSLYSMRGYDVAKLALNSILKGKDRALYTLQREGAMPLQTIYKFNSLSDSTKLQNTEWPLVVYNRDYSIDIE